MRLATRSGDKDAAVEREIAATANSTKYQPSATHQTWPRAAASSIASAQETLHRDGVVGDTQAPVFLDVVEFFGDSIGAFHGRRHLGVRAVQFVFRVGQFLAQKPNGFQATFFLLLGRLFDFLHCCRVLGGKTPHLWNEHEEAGGHTAR